MLANVDRIWFTVYSKSRIGNGSDSKLCFERVGFFGFLKYSKFIFFFRIDYVDEPCTCCKIRAIRGRLYFIFVLLDLFFLPFHLAFILFSSWVATPQIKRILKTQADPNLQIWWRQNYNQKFWDPTISADRSECAAYRMQRISFVVIIVWEIFSPRVRHTWHFQISTSPILEFGRIIYH